MKKSELRQMIREEIARTVNEAWSGPRPGARPSGSKIPRDQKVPTTYEIEYAVGSDGQNPTRLDAKRTVEKYGLQLLDYKRGHIPTIVIKGTPQKLHVFFKKVYDMDHDDYIDWAVG